MPPLQYELYEFTVRLAFGLALAMLALSPRDVTSGYFRNNSYVLLGLMSLAALIGRTAPSPVRGPGLLPALAAGASYAAAVAWLYEAPRTGKALLAIVSGLGLGCALAPPIVRPTSPAAFGPLAWCADLTSGLLLGATMAAMLLGHWHLNAPGMPLGPLRRATLLAAAATILRTLVAGLGLALLIRQAGAPDSSLALFLVLRWTSGLAGALVLAWMTWQTLRIPNTQSATGILYVSVIATFLGELTALLLSHSTPFPL